MTDRPATPRRRCLIPALLLTCLALPAGVIAGDVRWSAPDTAHHETTDKPVAKTESKPAPAVAEPAAGARLASASAHEEESKPVAKATEENSHAGKHADTPAVESKAAATDAHGAKSEAASAPADPLQRLLAGNKRFVTQQMSHPNQTTLQRIKVTTGQKPFAVILSCSDSRVPPEVVFDQGVGDLFVIRVAGNVVDDAGLASIEYAVDHLGTGLVVVLGHQRCGAVHAAICGGEPHGHLKQLMDMLQPAVNEARNQPGDTVDNTVRANVRRMTALLKNSKPILAEKVESAKVRIVGARYDLDTGEVKLVE